MEYFTKKWENKVRDYCDSQYELIEVTPGEINYYFKCHLVSTHYAIKNEHSRLALVVHRGESCLLPIVHFINHDGKNFIDNSLGNWTEKNEYRFIRWVNEKEFYSTGNILTDTKKFFYGMATFFSKTFGDISN